MSKCSNCTREQHFTKTIEDFVAEPQGLGVCHRCFQENCRHSAAEATSAGGKTYCAKCGKVKQ